MKLLSMVIGAALVAGVGVAAAQTPPIPLLRGPWDPGSALRTHNTLIQQINAILVPLLPSAGGIGLSPPSGGGDAVIGIAPGSADSTGIQLNPGSTGDIILFGDGDTGTLKFGNTGAFVTATGLTPCPGAQTATSEGLPFGVGPVVSSYIIIQDWTGAKRGIPAC